MQKFAAEKDLIHRTSKISPLRTLLFQRSPSRSGNPVILALTATFFSDPSGSHVTVGLELMQNRVEGAFFQMKHPFRSPLDFFDELIAIHFAATQHRKHQNYRAPL